MIIFLYGKDTFRSKQQLRRMVAKFKTDRDPQGLNVSFLDVLKKEDAGKVIEHAMGVPFLAERKMVVIENFLTSKEKELRAEMMKRLREGKIPESNVLIFWEGGETVRTKDGKEMLAHLAKEKFAQKFDELTGLKLEAWIGAAVKEKGATIQKDAVQYLAAHIGGDMWKLASLVDQLVAYTQGVAGGIALPDAQVFLGERADDNIFNLVDNIIAGNARGVHGMMQEQYNQGKDAGYIFAMVLRQVKILLQLRDMFERDENARSDVLAKQLGLHPFVVKKSLPVVKRFTLARLKGVYEMLLDIDIKTKTGVESQRTLLDMFVARQVSATPL